MMRFLTSRGGRAGSRLGLGLALTLLANGANAEPHQKRHPEVVRPGGSPQAPRPDSSGGAASVASKSHSPGPDAHRAESPADANARGLLRQMLQAERSLVLSGDQVTTVSRGGQTLTSEQRILRDGSRAFRLEYVQPPRLAGEQIVDNGHLFYHFVPATNSLEISLSRIEHFRDRVSLVLSQVNHDALVVQWIGQDTVAGHACGVIEVAPRDLTQASRRRFWIDPTNGAQLRIDEYNAAGQLASTSYYTQITYNPPLGRDAFQPPVTPKNVRSVSPEPVGPALTVPQAQAQAGFPVQQPTYLPAGFHLQSASVQNFRRSNLVALRYVNGLNVLSLFETPLNPNAHVQTPGKIKHPRPGIAMTTQNGLRMILVGNIGQDEMERMISSVR